MRTKLFNAIKVSLLALLLSFGLSFVYAWTAPTVTPPGGNVSAPINTSATLQQKSGDFTVANFVANTMTIGATINANAITAPQFCIGASCITAWPIGMPAVQAGSVKYSKGNGGWVIIPAGATTVTFNANGGGGGGAGGAGGSTAIGTGAGGGGGSYLSAWNGAIGNIGSGGNGGMYPNYGAGTGGVGPSSSGGGTRGGGGDFSNGQPGGSGGGSYGGGANSGGGGGGAFAYSLSAGWIVAVGGGGGAGYSVATGGTSGGGGGGYGGGGVGGTVSTVGGGGGGGGSYAHPSLSAVSASGRSIPVSITGQAIYLYAGLGGSGGANAGGDGAITMSWQ